MNPKYPVYIPSKSRYESRLTVKALEKINVPYKIVVEKEEYENYLKYINKENILILPESNKGLIYARNWIKQHSIKTYKAKRHWQLDDNISWFLRLNNNQKCDVASGTIFRCAEDFTDRFSNVAFSGFQYDSFAPRKSKHKPFTINTRIYSCTLVNNKIPYFWRSIYNDDTDICLQALKDGWTTILFYAFLAKKAQTMTVKGGNTEQLYTIPDGRLKMAQALKMLHPDVVTVKKRFNRWQHVVNYKPFKKNKLIPIKNLNIQKGINNYGMTDKTA